MITNRLRMMAAIAALGASGAPDNKRVCVIDDAHRRPEYPPNRPRSIEPPPRYRETRIAASSVDRVPAPPRVLTETELAAQAKRDRKAAKRRGQS